jgi:predicted amidophosphoribosyltransferase
MAIRKEEISDSYDKEKRAMKERTRITIDVSPELRQRIKLAAFQNNISISDYVGNILAQNVPDEDTIRLEKPHPVPPEFLERLFRLRDQISREANGQVFEDSAEAVQRMREERTKYLEEVREQK